MKTYSIELQTQSGMIHPFEDTVRAETTEEATRKFYVQALGYSEEEGAKIDDRTLKFVWSEACETLALKSDIRIQEHASPAPMVKKEINVDALVDSAVASANASRGGKTSAGSGPGFLIDSAVAVANAGRHAPRPAARNQKGAY